MNFYRPLSEASEGYVFTGVCHSFCSTPGGGGGMWHTKCNMGPAQNVYPPPGTRSECLPLPPWDQVRMSTSPLGPGQNVYPPWDQVRMSTPPQTTRRRAVRILLECILVNIRFKQSEFSKIFGMYLLKIQPRHKEHLERSHDPCLPGLSQRTSGWRRENLASSQVLRQIPPEYEVKVKRFR